MLDDLLVLGRIEAFKLRSWRHRLTDRVLAWAWLWVIVVTVTVTAGIVAVLGLVETLAAVIGDPGLGRLLGGGAVLLGIAAFLGIRSSWASRNRLRHMRRELGD